MTDFNPHRLALARQRSRLRVQDLAEKCCVDRKTVERWEAGSQVPSEHLIGQIAIGTSFEREFFFRPGIVFVTEPLVTFRSRARTPAKDKKAALAAATMATELVAWLEERFGLPPVDLPDLGDLTKPELAADLLRHNWGLGNKAIGNMIHLLEAKGVVVLSLAQDTADIDAFAFWTNGRPIVMLNLYKSIEHRRMDAAHELAHLVLHHNLRRPQEEVEARSFAGAFLMPRDSVQGATTGLLTLQRMMPIKKRWGTSLASVVVRLHEVGDLTEWQYRFLFSQLSKNGYRTQEPLPMTVPERSQVLKKVFDALASRQFRLADIARDMGWTTDQLQGFVFGLGATLLSVNGGRGVGQVTYQRPTSKLRLVEDNVAEHQPSWTSEQDEDVPL